MVFQQIEFFLRSLVHEMAIATRHKLRHLPALALQITWGTGSRDIHQCACASLQTCLTEITKDGSQVLLFFSHDVARQCRFQEMRQLSFLCSMSEISDVFPLAHEFLSIRTKIIKQNGSLFICIYIRTTFFPTLKPLTYINLTTLKTYSCSSIKTIEVKPCICRVGNSPQIAVSNRAGYF